MNRNSAFAATIALGSCAAIACLTEDRRLSVGSLALAGVAGAIATFVGADEEKPGLKEPPAYWGLPILGKAVQMGMDQKAFYDTHNDGLWRTQLFGEKVVIIPTAEHTEKIYRGEGTYIDNESALPKHTKDIMGEKILIVMHGEEHRRIRNAMIPCFTTSSIKTVCEPVQAIVDRYLRKWEAAGCFDAAAECQKMAFDIGTSFIGIDTSTMPEAESIHIRSLFTDAANGLMSVPIDLGRFSALGRAKIAGKRLQELMRDTITARQNLTRVALERGETPPNDVLQRLVELKDEHGVPVDLDTILSNMTGIAMASFETTATTLTSFLMCICGAPDVQEQAYEHIRDTLGAESDEFLGKKTLTYEQFAELDYLDQVILECERFAPPLTTSTFRKAKKDFELGGYLIKKGTCLIVEGLSRCSNKRYWERPDSFEPDRFGAARMEHKTGLGRNWKMSIFGGGSRQCPGRGFANFERKVVATAAFRDYKFSFADGHAPKVHYGIVMRIDGKFPVRIERRR